MSCKTWTEDTGLVRKDNGTSTATGKFEFPVEEHHDNATEERALKGVCVPAAGEDALETAGYCRVYQWQFISFNKNTGYESVKDDSVTENVYTGSLICICAHLGDAWMVFSEWIKAKVGNHWFEYAVKENVSHCEVSVCDSVFFEVAHAFGDTE